MRDEAKVYYFFNKFHHKVHKFKGSKFSCQIPKLSTNLFDFLILQCDTGCEEKVDGFVCSSSKKLNKIIEDNFKQFP